MQIVRAINDSSFFQVIMRSVLDGRSVVATDLGRRGSGSQKRGSSVDASGGGLSKPGTKNHSGVLFLYSRYNACRVLNPSK